MAADQEFITAMEPFQVFEGWDSREFSLGAAVAVGTAEHQIPDAIEIDLRMKGLQGIGIKMIHVTGEMEGAVDGDVAKAVEAFALLVAVQSADGRGDLLSAKFTINEQQFVLAVVLDIQQIS